MLLDSASDALSFTHLDCLGVNQSARRGAAGRQSQAPARDRHSCRQEPQCKVSDKARVPNACRQVRQEQESQEAVVGLVY